MPSKLKDMNIPRKLSSMNLLEGESEEITVMDLRRGPGDILDQVELGKTYTITRNGKVMAVLSKPEPDALELAAEVRRMGLVR